MLGIDVTETKQVKIGDATFTIGILPYGIRIKLDAELIKATGKKKAEDLLKEKLEDYAAFLGQNVQYVKFGVKGHSGIMKKDGTEIPFKSRTEFLDGREMKIVADETMDMFVAMGIVGQLSAEVLKFNIVTRQEEKN